MMLAQHLLQHWGGYATFLGGMVGGPIIVVLGGYLTHQHIMRPWVSLVCSAAGSATSNQILYLIGRVFRRRPAVIRASNGPRAKLALSFIDRHPAGYVLLYRFVMGIRSVSPVLIGLTGRVSLVRFLILNILGAIVWAAPLTALGYFSSPTLTILLARTRGLERGIFWGTIVVAAVITIHLYRRRPLRLGDTRLADDYPLGEPSCGSGDLVAGLPASPSTDTQPKV